jgi:hypothetical protein
MAAYMVGTPSKIVTRSRWNMSSALAGSNLGSRVSVLAVATAAFSPQVSPNTWNSGRQPMITSSGLFSISVLEVIVALRTSPMWVSSAPLGRPVVPDVYRITASSSSLRPDTSGATANPASRPWRSGVSAVIICAPASAAPLAASPAAACHAITALAPESPR